MRRGYQGRSFEYLRSNKTNPKEVVEEPEEKVELASQDEFVEHIVVQGETMYAISRKYVL